MPLAKRDYFFAALAGFVSGVLLIPILLNVGLPIPRLILFFVPALAGVGGFSLGLFILSLIARRIPVLFQFGKFVVVGSVNTLLDFGVLNFLSYLSGAYSGWLVAVFKAVAFSVAVTNSFFWNKYWTFGAENPRKFAKRMSGEGEPSLPDREGQTAKRSVEFLQFFLVSLGALVIGTATVYFVTTYVNPPSGISASLWENVANALATPLMLIWNFLGYKFIVFKR